MDINFVFEIFMTVTSLLVLVVPCFILAKCKLIGQTAENVLSVVVLYVCQPLMLVVSFQKTAFSVDILKNMLIVFVLAVVVHAIMIALVMLIMRKRSGDKKANVLKFSAVFSNCGYMGIPFLQLLYGDAAGEIIVYAGVVIGVFNILAWTIGVYMMTGDKSAVSVKKALLNPNIIGLIIGVIIFVILQKPVTQVFEAGSVGANVVTKLYKSVNFFADMVTPLSMSVIGIKLAYMSINKLFTDKTAYFSVLIKNVVMSFVALLVTVFLPVDITVKNVIFFTLSMPSATMSVLLAIRYDGDAEAATTNVLLSTALSVVTIPLLYMLFSALCGVV